MRLLYTDRFRRSYQEAPSAVQRAFDRRAEFLLASLRHPSLHAKKYDEARDLWQARVNASWRFYFQIKADSYILLDIMSHPK
jgi:plasmid maintenance system killer protein